MPYTNPPTFVDTDVLSASELNVLSDNQEYLKGQIDAGVDTFAVATANLSDLTTSYGFRYLGQDLHYKFTIAGGTMEKLDIRAYDEVDGEIEIIFNDETTTGNTQPGWDNTMTPLFLATGTWYRFEVIMKFVSGDSGLLYCWHIGNEPTP